jgi:small subunit ribosomal protein S4
LNLLQILESRLDNVIYRLGYADSRGQARLLVTHGHFMVNGRRNDVPSTMLSPGDVVTVRDGSRTREYFKSVGDSAENKAVLPWLSRDLRTLSGSVIRLPERSEIDGNLSEQLIVEYYSR